MIRFLKVIILVMAMSQGAYAFGFSSITNYFQDYFLQDESLKGFLNNYYHSFPKSEQKLAREQGDVYKEAYFLYIENYIYQVTDAQKEKLNNTATTTLKDAVAKLKKSNKPIKPDEVMEVIMDKVFNNIDAHTVWMSPKQSSEFMEQLTGNHKGIGILFNYDKQKNMIHIIKVFNNGPAEKAGLKKNDYIYAVEGKPILPDSKLEDVIASIKGEKGTKVQLTIESNNKKREVVVTRGDYYVPSVEYSKLSNNYGYISINSFNNDTVRLFKQALIKLNVNKLDGLVLDVRSNPGGLLTSVVLIADLFLSGETIVSIEGRIEENNHQFVSQDTIKIRKNLPVIVLTNFMSASAAELLSGSLSLNNRAILMGAPTFGKWSVQNSFTLKNSSIFNVTTQLFYAPHHATFQGIGIMPDIYIKDKYTKAEFREKDYKNYLKIKDNYNKKPQITINDTSCPEYGVDKDRIIGCAVLFLKSNQNNKVFLEKIKK